MGINHRISLSSDHNKRERRKSLKRILVIFCIIIFSSPLIFRLFDVCNTPQISYEDIPINWKFERRAHEELLPVSVPSRRMKYMLLWTSQKYAPFYYFYGGQKVFIDNKCSSVNCFVTANRNIFNGDLTKFDAIAFNGRYLRNIDLPKFRTARQKYIYFNTESAQNYPVCNEKYNNFFNWTATFRLDSDIVSPYIEIRNQRYEVIGPKHKMEWPRSIYRDDKFDHRQNKTKAVAWFASKCKTRSQRETVAFELRNELLAYGQTVDIYGKCGTLTCPLKNKTCNGILKNDYFFYLSFENSITRDYVTEKLLIALNNNVVPIVLGGADYSRFLPPGSYLDAGAMSLRSLAATIIETMNSPSKYNEFFKWKSNKYKYSDPSRKGNLCAVCAALNNETFYNTPSYYPDFRSWWHPGYKKRCRKYNINLYPL